MGVWAWGAGTKGQLGSGGLEDSPAPLPVPSLSSHDIAGWPAGAATPSPCCVSCRPTTLLSSLCQLTPSSCRSLQVRVSRAGLG